MAEARVFGSGVETTSDAAGHFDLGPLPSGKTEIIAWKDDGFALSSSDQTRLDLKTQTLTPTDPERAGTVVAALQEETKGTKYWRRDSLASMLLGGDFDANAAQLSTAGFIGVYRLIVRFAPDASIPTAKWVALLSGVKSPSDRLYSTAIWSSRVPSIPRDEATIAFANSLETDVAAIEKDGNNNWQNSIGIFGAAALFERLGQNAKADALFERGQVYVLKNFPETGGKDGQNPSQDDTLSVMGEVAAVSPRFLSKMVALVDSDSAAYSRLLKDGAPVVARLNGLDAAQPLLDQLKAAPPSKPDHYGNNTSISYSWQQAVTDAISAGGASNPKLALSLAQSLPKNSDSGNGYGRDAALGEAALFQSPEVAAGVWRESLPRLEPGAAMRFIARIAQTDEPLAHGFYEAARERFDAQLNDTQSAMMDGRGRQVAAFAFYEARFAPARARARLERGFGAALKDPNSRYDIGQYVRAMAVLDTDRALQWAGQIGNDENSGFAGFEGKRSIARWLSLDSSARQKFDFGDRSGRGEGD